MSRGQDDQALIRNAVAGQPRAQIELCSRLNLVISARIRRRLSHFGTALEDRVQDLAQEVWLALYENGAARLRRFRPGGLSLENYVGNIAEQTGTNQHRKNGAVKRGGGLTAVSESVLSNHPTTDPSPERRVEARALLNALTADLESKLTPLELFVFHAHHADKQLSINEIAALLKVKPEVIYAARARIRKLSREFTKKWHR